MKTYHVLAVVILFVSQLSIAHAAINDDLLVHLPLDGNAYDVVGGYYGTVDGATPAVDRFGNANSAYQFDGNDDFISTNFGSGQTYPNGITISAWVRSTDSDDSGIVVSRNGWDFLALNAGLHQGIPGMNVPTPNVSTYYTANAGASINDNQWHHVLGTYDGSTVSVYLDGQLEGSVPGTGTAHSEDVFKIGWDDTGSNSIRFFEGRIDDVKIWDRALSASEVTTLAPQKLTVPANPLSTVTSAPLHPNTLYVVEARGTYQYNVSNSTLVADAEWWRHSDSQWRETYPSESERSLDLLVNGNNISWHGSSDGNRYSPGTFSPDHVYRHLVTGNGNPISFQIDDPSSAWNNSGSLEVKIQAVSSISNKSDYAVPVTNPTPPVERLAEWNGSDWIPVLPDSLGSGNVRVITHGWANGLRPWVDDRQQNNEDAKAWLLSDYGDDWFDGFTDMAADMKILKPNDQILAFSWIDLSATHFGTVARESRNNADSAGGELAKALVAAGVDSNTQGIHLIGHSHGSVVSAEAAILLENCSGLSGDCGIHVDQVTLLDSPEKPITDIFLIDGKNNLSSYLSQLDIGIGADKTYIDNYSSFYGEDYGHGVVNIRLSPHDHGVFDLLGTGAAEHGYPVEWYTDAVVKYNGFAWSHLGVDPNTSLDLGGVYFEDPNVQYQLNWTVDGTVPVPPQYTHSTSQTTTVGTPVNVTVSGGHTENTPVWGIARETSPAFWDMILEIDEDDVAVEFDFEFVVSGDGDQLGIWVDDELRFIVTGDQFASGLHTSVFDVSSLSPGPHLLSVALHSTGEANAEMRVGNFRTVSLVPEPSTFVLLALSVIGLIGRRVRI